MKVSGCTCRPSSRTLCPVCATLAQRAGHDLPAPPARTLPSLQQRYPEEAALRQLQAVADACGWVPNLTWNPHGRYQGLGAEFVRDSDMLYVQVLREGSSITPDQHLWLEALRATGKIEVHVCTVATLDAILARLSHPATP